MYPGGHIYVFSLFNLLTESGKSIIVRIMLTLCIESASYLLCFILRRSLGGIEHLWTRFERWTQKTNSNKVRFHSFSSIFKKITFNFHFKMLQWLCISILFLFGDSITSEIKNITLSYLLFVIHIFNNFTY